jgi:hypothetical protein
MKQKSILLFLALLLPVCIFLFLKFFGKNEFSVPPLYADVYPENTDECGNKIMLPYVIPDSLKRSFNVQRDSLSLIYFGDLRENSMVQLKRVNNDFRDAVRLHILSPSEKSLKLKTCVFFLKDSLDLVLIDPSGVIRGQYKSDDREEVDRLLTELTILLKRY